MDQGAVREAGMYLNHHSQKRKWSHSLSSPFSLLNRPVCYCTSEMILSFCSYIPLTPVLPWAGKSNWEMMANFQLLKITVWMNEQGAMLNFPRGKFQGWWERTVQQLWPPRMDSPSSTADACEGVRENLCPGCEVGSDTLEFSCHPRALRFQVLRSSIIISSLSTQLVVL